MWKACAKSYAMIWRNAMVFASIRRRMRRIAVIVRRRVRQDRHVEKANADVPMVSMIAMVM